MHLIHALCHQRNSQAVCVCIYIYIICDTKCMFVTCSNPLKLLCLTVDKTRGLLYELPEFTH